jgi:hypothetical protein
MVRTSVHINHKTQFVFVWLYVVVLATIATANVQVLSILFSVGFELNLVWGARQGW